MAKWYQGFFDELVLDLWSRSNSPEQTAAEVEMIQDLCGCRPGCRILDLACGMGRHALGLARLGCGVTAVDLSGDALRAVRTSAEREDLAIHTVQCDLADLEVPGSFDGSCLLGNSFGYLDAGATLGFFQRLANCLEPGAGFLLHTGMAAECLLPNLDERNWVQVGGAHLLLENEYHSREGFLVTRYTILDGKRQEAREAKHYVFTVSEIGRMLDASGFETIAHFASSEQDAFDVGDPELYLFACRRSER